MYAHTLCTCVSIFTSVLFGKNQHKTPSKPPNTTPINSSIGPLKMFNTMFPRIFKYQHILTNQFKAVGSDNYNVNCLWGQGGVVVRVLDL